MARKKTMEYGNDSITTLKGADRVRKRPAVIFGSDGIVDMRVSDGRRYLRGCRSFVWEWRACGVCGGFRSRALSGRAGLPRRYA